MRLTNPQALCEPHKCGNAAPAQQLQQVLIPVIMRLQIFHMIQLFVSEAFPHFRISLTKSTSTSSNCLRSRKFFAILCRVSVIHWPVIAKAVALYTV
jgi:hypothetical protein